MRKESPSTNPLVSDLVLIGGGHAQVHVIKMCGMEPYRSILANNGIRVTLIARDIMTPYSGMLPGYISGHYTFDQIHIDLNRLCSFAGIRLIHAAASKIVPEKKPSTTRRGGGGLVYCNDNRPPVRYDALSIDIGSRPSGWGGSAEEISEDGLTPVKPIAGFATRYANLLRRLEKCAKNYTKESPFKLLVVGGGAGGIELVLSAQYNLTEIFRKVGADVEAIKVSLATRGTSVLLSHNKKVRNIFQRILKERNVELFFGANITGMETYDDKSTVSSKSNDKLPLYRILMAESSSSILNRDDNDILFHECLWCTSAGAPTWLKSHTPLQTTDDGFVKINDTYECFDHPGIFAAGDCCHNVRHPRPKAGVFAVRAGPTLLKNLFNYLLNKKLESFSPQKTFLSLISTGDKYAVACRGSFAFEGSYFWTLKDTIDISFMNKFKNLPIMDKKEKIPANVVAQGSDAMIAFAAAPMRCGGCGAKVGATTVSRVLKTVRQRSSQQRRELSLNKSINSQTSFHGIGSFLQHFGSGKSISSASETHEYFDADDAAVVPLPEKGGGCAIHTIDFFRSFISDPFVFGKIAAIHAMSDCHAMGAMTQNCLALAVVPYSAEEAITEDTLISMLSGASDVLTLDNCELVGGHTCEGAELALGFSVNGYIDDAAKLLRKNGGRIGDKIVITKPIGTGAIFAADMRAQSKSVFVEEALERMTQSSGPASRVAMSYIEENGNKGIHACTDITGFGLAGHLLEMLTANDADDQNDCIEAALDLNHIPFYNGAIDASKRGIYSSLQRENSRTRRAVINHTEAAQASPYLYPLIYDPQTAGGLLFFVSSDFCDEFIRELRKPENGGYACVIGELESHQKDKFEEEGVCMIGGGSKTSGKRIRINL